MGGAVAVGLMVEEHRAEIHEAWTEAVRAALPGEPALEFTVGPLLRELSLALRGDVRRSSTPRPDPHTRCAVLVRSAASGARVAREFKLLHRVLWDTLRAAGRVVAADERRATDEWLDDALAASLERLERIRSRIELLERGPEIVAPARPSPLSAQPAPRVIPAASHPAPPSARPLPSGQRPPPLPWNRARALAPASAELPGAKDTVH